MAAPVQPAALPTQRAPEQPLMPKAFSIAPPEQPPAFEFSYDPPSLSAQDIDVIKLTAQFVARNGRVFLNQLTQREARNYQFDFLRPQHSLFPYFSKLVEQYALVLMPSDGLLEQLRRDRLSHYHIMTRVKRRVDFGRYESRQQQAQREKEEKEREAYNAVDWHDFAIVETIEFRLDEGGDYPAPVRKEGGQVLAGRVLLAITNAVRRADVGARVVAMERMEAQLREQHQLQQQQSAVSSGGDDMDMDVEAPSAPSTSSAAAAVSTAPVLPKTEAPAVHSIATSEGSVKVVKNYDPHAVIGQSSRTSPISATQSCPRCGLAIPMDKMGEHLRVCMLDSRWREQREKQEKDKQEMASMFASGSDISSHLRSFAVRCECVCDDECVCVWM
jgi:splicing factor 3A subunit 1